MKIPLTETNQTKAASPDILGVTFQNLLMQAPIAVVVLSGPNYIVELANDCYLQTLDKDASILNKPAFDTSPLAEKQGFREILEHVKITGQTYHLKEHLTFLQRNGTVETAYLNLTYQPIRETDGSIDRIMIMLTEVTDQVLQRKKLEESLGLLSAQKDQIETSINAGKVGTWYLDASRNHLYWSKEQEALYGIPAGSFDGQLDTFLSFLVDDRQLLLDKHREKGSGLVENTYTFRIRRPDDSIRWIQSRDKALYNHNGELQYVAGINIDITEQKMLEERLGFAATLNLSIRDAVIATSSKEDQYRIISWNKGAENIYGWKAEEVIGRPVREIIETKFDTPEIQAQLFPTLDKQGFWEGEVEQPKRDGTPIRIWASVSNVKDNEGKVIGSVVINKDITDAYRNRQIIRDNEERMRFALEAAHMIAWEWNIQTGEVYRSSNAYQSFGIEGSAAQDFLSLVHPDDRSKVDEAVKKTLEEDAPYECEYRLQTKDQTIIWVTDKAQLVRNAEGTPMIMTGIVMDITKRKLAEEALKRSEQELKDLANAMPQLVWMADGTPNVFYYNDRVQFYEGVHKKDDGSWSWESMCHPDDLQATYDAWFKAIEEGVFYESQQRVLMKDGTYRWHLSRAYPQKDETGQVVKWIGTATDIHEQKINEERFRLLFNYSPAAIWLEDFSLVKKQIDELLQAGITDIRSYFETNRDALLEMVQSVVVKEVNAASLELYGGSKEELLAGLQTFFVDDTLEAFIQEMETIAHGGGRFETETSVRNKQGAILRVLARIDFPTDNDYSNVQVTLFDVTEKKKAEAAIQQSEFRFRNLAFATTSIIWTTDAEGKFVTEQTSWQRYTGQTWDEYKDWGWTKMSHPDDLPKFMELWAEAVRTKKEYRSEGRMWSEQHGEYRYFRSTAIPIQDADGHILEWVGMNTDVHEQLLAEQAVKDSEARFRTLAEALPQMIWIMEPLGKPLYMSGRWKAYSGIEDGEAAWDYMIHPSDREPSTQKWMECLQTGEIFQAEIRLRNHEGQYRWHQSISLPVLNDQQQVALWIGTITDIHEQRTFREKLEQEVAQRTMDLQRSNNDLQQFAHVASHDLKEPVRKVRTFVSRLQQEFNEVLPLQAQNYLAKIDASTSRMYNMIDGVLLYSSLNAAEIQPEPVDLNELIQTIEADLEIAITQKQAVLHCVSLPVISGSGVLLYQLFYNLINNSLKFAQPHLPPVIHISADVQRNETGKGGMIGQASHYCKIVMQDNGIGFQEDEAHKIFDAFVRLHSKDKYEGTGLGLSLCKNIVERHGGRIAAKGEENKGACFTILLPM